MIQFAHNKDELTAAHGVKVEGDRLSSCSVNARRFIADRILAP